MIEVAHCAPIAHQEQALAMLMSATERVLDQAATVATVANIVASGNGTMVDIARLGELSSYLDRLIQEREQYAEFAAFTGASRTFPGEYDDALKGCKVSAPEWDQQADLDRLREQLAG